MNESDQQGSVNDQHVPARLYKYMPGGEDGILRLFQSGMLRFTQPVEFNDPFEMQPFVKSLADEPTLKTNFYEQLEATLESEIENALARLPLEHRILLDRDSLLRKARQNAPQAFSLVEKLAAGFTPHLNRQIYQTVNQNLVALCLTEKPVNLLMWAHYADEHRGVVVEFDTSHAFFNRRIGPNDDFRHFRKVVYTRQRPAVSLSKADAVDFFYFKSTEWEYEHEWRLIVPLADCSQRINQSPHSPICLFHVPPQCIRSVIVGCRMQESEKFKLAKVVRLNPAYRHIEFEQAEPSDRVFEIQRRAVTAEALDRWITVSR